MRGNRLIRMLITEIRLLVSFRRMLRFRQLSSLIVSSRSASFFIHVNWLSIKHHFVKHWWLQRWLLVFFGGFCLYFVVFCYLHRFFVQITGFYWSSVKIKQIRYIQLVIMRLAIYFNTCLMILFMKRMYILWAQHLFNINILIISGQCLHLIWVIVISSLAFCSFYWRCLRTHRITLFFMFRLESSQHLIIFNDFQFIEYV